MLHAITLVVEMFYFIQNLNVLLPHCFLLNILQSFVSGSNTVSVLIRKISPNAIQHGKKQLTCLQDDVITFYDNIGKHINLAKMYL